MNGYEQQYYKVHPSQLRWAMSRLGAMPGHNVLDYQEDASGMYIIVVQAPVGAGQSDWRGAPRRGPSFRPLVAFDWRVFVQIVCVLAIVGGMGYLAYSVFAGEQPTLAGVPVEVGGMKIGPDGRMVPPTAWEQAQGALADARDWLRGLLPKQQPQAAPVKVPAPWWRFWNQEPDTVGPDADATEWTWPPKNPIGDAWDGTMQLITWLTYAVIVLGVLWAVSFVMGIVGKFRR